MINLKNFRWKKKKKKTKTKNLRPATVETITWNARKETLTVTFETQTELAILFVKPMILIRFCFVLLISFQVIYIHTPWGTRTIPRPTLSNWNCAIYYKLCEKKNIQELWFVRSAHRLMLVNISMKFHEDILNGFQVTERTQDFVTETATYKV